MCLQLSFSWNYLRDLTKIRRKKDVTKDMRDVTKADNCENCDKR